jgi:hypothetical protein
MKKLFAAFAVLLVSSFSSAQNVTREENEWLKALTPIYHEATAAGIKVSIALMVDQKPGQTPAFMAFKGATKECQFVIAVRGNEAAKSLFTIARSQHERQVVMRTILAHEYSHCLQQLADEHLYAHVADVQPGGALVSHSKVEEEAAADVFALAWTARNHPGDFHMTYQFLDWLRSVGTQDDTGRYAVQAWLKKAKNMPTLMAETSRSPFEVAMELVYGQPTAATTKVASAQ